jgi:hypothetical protein
LDTEILYFYNLYCHTLESDEYAVNNRPKIYRKMAVYGRNMSSALIKHIPEGKKQHYTTKQLHYKAVLHIYIYGALYMLFNTGCQYSNKKGLTVATEIKTK